ncbi:DUF4838 domain-containing protein [candidate division KSB1 bacterium]|nr:DUF4838 domain-containing protein [candidate division KSB1 bacterium]
MEKRILFSFCMFFLIFFGCVEVGDDNSQASENVITLVDNGYPVFEIVLPDNPNSNEIEASSILQWHINQLTGTKFNIVNEGNRNESSLAPIFIGKCDSVKSYLNPFQVPKRQEYCLNVTPNYMCLYGDDEIPNCGTRDAVYYFIQKVLGYNYLWPGDLGRIVPKNKWHLKTSLSNVKIVPFFKKATIRNFLNSNYVFSELTELNWDPSMFDNFVSSIQEWLNFHRFGGVSSISYGHAFIKYWELYHKTNPEWFAYQVTGTRDHSLNPSFAQFCVSNDQLTTTIANNILELSKIANNDALSICLNDHYQTSSFCFCPICESWDHPEGAIERLWTQYGYVDHVSLSDRFVKFFNNISDKVYAINPELMLTHYAYYPYTAPPLVNIPAKNLITVYVPGLHFFTTRQFYEKELSEIRKWASLSNNPLIIRPNFLAGLNGIPLNYGRLLIDTFCQFRSLNIKVYDFDCFYQMWASDGINVYLLAKLISGEDVNYDSELSNYCHVGFPGAFLEIRQYFDLLEKITFDYFNRSPQFPNISDFFTKEQFINFSQIFNNAKKNALDDLELKRINFLENGINFAQLKLSFISARLDYHRNPNPQTEAAFKLEQEKLNKFYENIGLTFAIIVPIQKKWGY